MSLDVYLKLPGAKESSNGSGIFIREDGQTKEISRAEWNEKFPNYEPISVTNQDEDDYVYEANITHNLSIMADDAGLHRYLWRPDENEITHASQLIEPLEVGLALLKSDPKRFKKFNPPNGWGDYDGLVRFTEDYLNACKEYPRAEVYTSR